jgi:hypothetical protein
MIYRFFAIVINYLVLFITWTAGSLVGLAYFFDTENVARASVIERSGSSPKKSIFCHELLYERARDSESNKSKTLRYEAEDLIRKLELEFEKRFTTSGFANYNQFLQAIRQSSDPYIQQAIKLLDADKVRPIIHAPDGSDKYYETHVEDYVLREPGIRLSIARKGLQNNYVTKKSRGDASFKTRSFAELGYLGLRITDLDLYMALDSEIKPKSGTVYFEEEIPVEGEFPAARYGKDVWIPKSSVYNRLGFYPGDTLNQLWLMPESPLGDSVRNTGSISELYIPWKYRYFMVPLIAGGLKEGKGNQPFLLDGWFSRLDPSYLDHHWWETQIFGPLTLDDFKEFIFRENPPAGEFLDLLKQHDIKILDGRKSPPQPWGW